MDPLFREGFSLMLMGMGVVFAFLVLLVFMVGLMSRAVLRFSPEAEVVPSAQAPAAPSATDSRTLAVIRDAIRQHRAAGR